jgi:hypothetical protein
MPNFEEHLRDGIAGHAVIVFVVWLGYLAGLVPLRVVLLAAATVVATLAGATFPDTDHASAKPYRLFCRTAPPLVAASAALTIFPQREHLVTVSAKLPVTADPRFIAGLLYSVIIAGIWAGTVRLIPHLRPKHRTLTHQLRAGIIVALWLAVFTALAVDALQFGSTISRTASLLVGTGFVIGQFVHLKADELIGIGE